MNLVKVKLFRGLGRDCSNVFIYLDLYLYTTYEDEVVVWSLRYVLFFATLWTVACQATLPWDFPGKNTGVGCHFLLQRIFPTQESNPHLLHCRRILYCWATGESHEDKVFYLNWLRPLCLSMLSFVLEDIRVATKMKIELGILLIEVLRDIFCGSQLFLYLVVILSYIHRNIFQKYCIK